MIFKEIVDLKEAELNELKKQIAHQSFKDDHALRNFESEQVALLSQVRLKYFKISLIWRNVQLIHSLIHLLDSAEKRIPN